MQFIHEPESSEFLSRIDLSKAILLLSTRETWEIYAVRQGLGQEQYIGINHLANGIGITIFTAEEALGHIVFWRRHAEKKY